MSSLNGISYLQSKLVSDPIPSNLYLRIVGLHQLGGGRQACLQMELHACNILDQSLVNATSILVLSSAASKMDLEYLRSIGLFGEASGRGGLLGCGCMFV